MNESDVIVCLLQDFALDSEEVRMRGAAHYMVKFMTSGMALITCREPLMVNIANNIKTAFMNTLRVSDSLVEIVSALLSR